MSKGKGKTAFRWWGDWAVLWIFGGFAVAYFIYIPITGDKVHPPHWLFGFLGGAVGYGIDTGLTPLVRSVRRGLRRRALEPGKGNSKKGKGR